MFSHTASHTFTERNRLKAKQSFQLQKEQKKIRGQIFQEEYLAPHPVRNHLTTFFSSSNQGGCFVFVWFFLVCDQTKENEKHMKIC